MCGPCASGREAPYESPSVCVRHFELVMTIRRNSLRYQGNDYRDAGGYFVTLCTHKRQALFDTIVDGVMIQSLQGNMAKRCWLGITDQFPGAQVDIHIVMPDHLHGVLFLGSNPDYGSDPELADTIRWFKNSVHAEYRKQVVAGTWSPYFGKLWQRRYHDRIIRNERVLEQIRNYMLGNPACWQQARTNA